jgi:hypothetical protein
MLDGSFLELTVLYRTSDRDPRDGPNRSEKRLFSTAQIKQIVPNQSTPGQAVITTADGGFFVVAEAYEYLSQILTSWQPRLVETRSTP